MCHSLADAAEHLPHLAHISFAMELDALLSSSQAAGLSPLAGLKQLTSLAFVGYQVGATAIRVARLKWEVPACKHLHASTHHGFQQACAWQTAQQEDIHMMSLPIRPLPILKLICTHQRSCVSCLQYLHPDSSAHEGYALVPPVLAELPSLQSLRLTVNSGQNVDLTPAAAVPEVNLVLTLAHYEQTPFNRSVVN